MSASYFVSVRVFSVEALFSSHLAHYRLVRFHVWDHQMYCPVIPASCSTLTPVNVPCARPGPPPGLIDLRDMGYADQPNMVYTMECVPVNQ